MWYHDKYEVIEKLGYYYVRKLDRKHNDDCPCWLCEGKTIIKTNLGKNQAERFIIILNKLKGV